jgi:hypothetical protein
MGQAADIGWATLFLCSQQAGSTQLAVPPEQLTYQPSFLFHGLAALPVTLT